MAPQRRMHQCVCRSCALHLAAVSGAITCHTYRRDSGPPEGGVAPRPCSFALLDVLQQCTVLAQPPPIEAAIAVITSSG